MHFKAKGCFMFAKFRNAFISGIAVILPIAITFIIFRFLFDNINDLILNPLIKSLRPYLADPHALYAAKAGIFVLLIFAVCLIGWGANILVLRRFFGIWERIFLKIPMLGKIYNAVKQIGTAFLGQGKTIFKKVLLIEYPRKGVYSIGFVTGESQGEIQALTKQNVLNVFVPTTPNPTSGVFLLVPQHEVIYLKMTVEEGMKLVISGGAVSPPFNFSEKQYG